MTDSPQPEQIWVSVLEATKITGYNRDYIRRLLREIGGLPEAGRSIQLRLVKHAYEIWLPDLLQYIEERGRGPAQKPELDTLPVEEIWATPIEAAQMMGYHPDYIRKLVNKINKQTEDSREVKIRRRSFGYEIWVPDLVAYLKNVRASWFRKDSLEY